MKSFTSIAVLVVGTTTVFGQLQPCNLAQLAGDDELFSVSGGGGTYEPGSVQEVDWDRPSGAPVRRIRANVTIVDLDTNESFEPSNVTGVPVEFVEQESHLNGTIEVTLPDDIPESENYVFRVTVRSRGSLCYLDTSNFTVAAVSPPENCTPGAMVCTDDFAGFQQCVETDETAAEFDFGEIIPCAATTVCSQVNETVIQCAAPPVVDVCNLGDFQCDPESDGSQECVVDATTGGTVWGPTVPCEDGFSCNDETGVCEEDEVVDVCVENTTECVTETSNRVCVVDETTGGTVWSEPANCPVGTTCDPETGLCTSGTGNGCTPFEQVCLTEVSFDTCVQNEDGFWSMSGTTTLCPENFICVDNPASGDFNTVNCISNATDVMSNIMHLRSRNLFSLKF